MPTTPAGIHTAPGTELPENYQLTRENKELLDLYDKLDVNSLQASVLQQYISAAKYEEDGIVKYRKLEDEENTNDLASKVMQELRYHFHIRQVGMSQEDFERFSQYEVHGQKYLDSVLNNFIPSANQKGLEKMLSNQPVNLQVIDGLTKQFTQSYLQNNYVAKIKDLHNNEVPKMAEGLVNMQNFVGESKTTSEELMSQGIEHIMEKYLGSIFKALEKKESDN